MRATTRQADEQWPTPLLTIRFLGAWDEADGANATGPKSQAKYRFPAITYMNREFDDLVRAIKHWARVVSISPEYDEFCGYSHDSIIAHAGRLVAAYYRQLGAGIPDDPSGEDLPSEALANYFLKLLIQFDLRIRLSASRRKTYVTATGRLGRSVCLEQWSVGLTFDHGESLTISSYWVYSGGAGGVIDHESGIAERGAFDLWRAVGRAVAAVTFEDEAPPSFCIRFDDASQLAVHSDNDEFEDWSLVSPDYMSDVYFMGSEH